MRPGPGVATAAHDLVQRGHALLAGGRAGQALRELERAADSAAPASAELVAARAIESFARMSVGDLDGAWSAGAEAQSARPAGGDPDVRAATSPLVLAAKLHTSLAVASLPLVAQLRGELSSALQLVDRKLRRRAQASLTEALSARRAKNPAAWLAAQGLSLATEPVLRCARAVGGRATNPARHGPRPPLGPSLR